MSAFFEYDVATDGVMVRLVAKRLLGGRRSVPFGSWAEEAPVPSMAAVGAVTRLVAEYGGDPDAPVRQHGDGVFLTHRSVAGLSEHQAVGLGLPPSTTLMLGIQSSGDIAQPEFDVSCRWLESGSVNASGVQVTGCFLRHRQVPARIPEPLFGIWCAIAALRASDTTDTGERFRHIAALKEALPSNRRGLDVHPYILNTTVAVASAFSLNFSSGKNGFDFDPLLFGRGVGDAWTESGGVASIGESESLLSDDYQKRFAEHFRGWEQCRDRYALGSRYYVYVEPGLREALNVVRRVQGADAETRRDFARDPQAHLKAALADRYDEAAVERMFIATEEYSRRVLDLAVWKPPVLPWIKPVPNSWLPEAFGIMVGDTRVVIPPEEVEECRRKLDEAIRKGADEIEIGGHRVPANRATKDALENLLGMMRPPSPPPEPPGGTTDGGDEGKPLEPPGSDTGRKFLVVGENFETIAFAPPPVVRTTYRFEVPHVLRTVLKPHQVDGLRWLEECWCAGYPGCLLADDMGLGKSLQALAFLAWLRQHRRAHKLEKRPVLGVVPIGLLRNWTDEIALHLEPKSLGDILALHGSGVVRLKAPSARKGADTLDGSPTLDTNRIAEADLVLTSYDAMRDYHHSFAKIRFAGLFYDEVQKLKNPASQWAAAAKTLNADFTIAMTGTPIENRAEDLWAIMDIAYPGYLPPLKEFSQRYSTDDPEALGELRSAMLDRRSSSGEAPGDRPAVMLRRMKADNLKGLPEKLENHPERPMPFRQAGAYRDAVVKGKSASSPGDMLRTLHELRGISLHPVDPQQGRDIAQADYVAWSARLSITFDILRDIAAKREKVLIFLESLDMQDVLAIMLKREFHLKEQPMLIHGGVPGDRRKQFVDAFQSRRNEFDVMILSPKAGGVGLTITAANHVIHLSRWWNPAVEDQCTDRVYRIGQDRVVHVHYPLAVHPDQDLREYSFDLKLDRLLDRKRNLSRGVLVPPISPGDEAELFRDTVGGGPARNGEVDSLVEIDRMTARQFENWVLHRMCAKGWSASGTPVTADGGADGILKDPHGNCAIIQAKHRRGDKKCDEEPIDDLLRARKRYGMPTAILYAVTNAKGYTSEARERAERHNIVLIYRDNIMQFTEI